MESVTLGIAILLTAGLFLAKVLQLLRLPSVTGFIVAGVLLGPSGLGVISDHGLGDRLGHFTQIALMLIAFGIGEHVEVRRLRGIGRDVTVISIVQALAAFTVVTVAILAACRWLPTRVAEAEHLPLALLLGAVAVATAPAAVLHVVRETKARGKMTATLMAVVAVDDGIAIIIFGLAVSLVHQLVGQGGSSGLTSVLASLSEVLFSLAAGLVTGWGIDQVVHRLHRREEMLTAGLALLLLCGELTRLVHLSPLLAGMMAGFILINRCERDVRLFRALNAFEPPIYVLFFTLAGLHLELSALAVAGWLGLLYFFGRVAGKVGGTWLGGLLSRSDPKTRNWLGLALLPQAGVAIGLVFMIAADPVISGYSTVITPVVLAGVVLSEVFGPLLVRLGLEQAGETEDCGKAGERLPTRLASGVMGRPQSCRLDPWPNHALKPVARPEGTIVFGALHYATVRGLARVATILAHHQHRRLLSVRVLEQAGEELPERQQQVLFLPEEDEAASLGYPLDKLLLQGDPAVELLRVVADTQAKGLVIGYPVGLRPMAFHQVLNRVLVGASCPVIVVRQVGAMNFEQLLVPFLSLEELEQMLPLLEAIVETSDPTIMLLYLVSAEADRREIEQENAALARWRRAHLVESAATQLIVPAPSRLETILSEAGPHRMIVMAASRPQGLWGLLTGSLAHSVVRTSRNPVCCYYNEQTARIPAARAGKEEMRGCRQS